MRANWKRMIGVFLFAAGLLIAVSTLRQSGVASPARTEPVLSPSCVVPQEPAFESTSAPDQVSTEEPAPEESDALPVGKLVISPERTAYEDGALTLTIPALGVVRTVHDGTDSEDLQKGVGLYEYAQLPGEGNRNVSIAGHRNGISNGKITDRAPFYYVDTLMEGDYLYLADSENIYRYLWESCTIVEADDWTPIYTTGSSCITLTSCHPIGVSDHRIVVRGTLDRIFPYDDAFDYQASQTDDKA